MFIYNVTTKVDWSINDAWLEWMLNEHMQQLLDTKCFTEYKLMKLHDVDDSDGPTYAAQYFAESKALYNRYVEIYAPQLREIINNKWSNGLVSFRTLMEVVS